MKKGRIPDQIIVNCFSNDQANSNISTVEIQPKNLLTPIFLTRREEELFENAVRRYSTVEEMLVSIE